jgi:hypothetical protein
LCCWARLRLVVDAESAGDLADIAPILAPGDELWKDALRKDVDLCGWSVLCGADIDGFTIRPDSHVGGEFIFEAIWEDVAASQIEEDLIVGEVAHARIYFVEGECAGASDFGAGEEKARLFERWKGRNAEAADGCVAMHTDCCFIIYWGTTI